jgi:hypothetical protein
MCFSESISLYIGSVGLLAGLYFFPKNRYAAIGIGYFALMEILQYFQYKVINQCENPVNQFLTKLGYVHISFQPLFFNLWLLAFTQKRDPTFLYVSFFGGLLLCSRLIGALKDDEVCDGKNEPICGKRTCAFSGEKHIAWNVRLRAAGKHWFTPSIGLHFFLWVVPVLLLREMKPFLAMLLTGPYLGILLTGNIHEQPAIWCYTAISQMLVSYYLLVYPVV